VCECVCVCERESTCATVCVLCGVLCVLEGASLPENSMFPADPRPRVMDPTEKSTALSFDGRACDNNSTIDAVTSQTHALPETFPKVHACIHRK